MSENLDLVRSICSSWERGDFSAADWADPGIEYVHADGPDPTVSRGLPAMRAAVGERASVWRDFRFVPDAQRELDSERVLVLGHRSGRGRTSGLDLDEVPMSGAMMFHISGGKVTRLVAYFDRDRALADLGLKE
jgi:hypothetical protein